MCFDMPIRNTAVKLLSVLYHATANPMLFYKFLRKEKVEKNRSLTHLCLPLLADLLAPEVRSRSVGRTAVEWAVISPSCSDHWLLGRRQPCTEGEATKPSSSDNSCCCFFRRAFCLARSRARLAFARSCRSSSKIHITQVVGCLPASLQKYNHYE